MIELEKGLQNRSQDGGTIRRTAEQERTKQNEEADVQAVMEGAMKKPDEINLNPHEKANKQESDSRKRLPHKKFDSDCTRPPEESRRFKF